MTEISNQKTYGIYNTPHSRAIIKRFIDQKIPFIELPRAEIIETELSNSEVDLLKNITDFDWLVFFEPVSVEVFLKRLCELEKDLFELDNVRICVLGELTSDKLRYEQIHSDIIFSEASNLTELISNFNADESYVTQKIMFVKANEFENVRLESFRNQNPASLILNIFYLKFDADSNLSKIKALISGGAIDEIVLTSPEDLLSLEFGFVNSEKKNEFEDIQISANDNNLLLFLKDKGYQARSMK